MDLHELFEQVQAGNFSPKEAILKVTENSFATVDHDRERRSGFPEVILAEYKTTEQIITIAKNIYSASGRVLITRVKDLSAEVLKENFPFGEHNRTAKTFFAGTKTTDVQKKLLIIAAGTSDLPVAEEAKETAAAIGCTVQTLYDVGVAGLHRLLSKREYFTQAKVIIVIAGMEGALPSVVGGLTSKPVIAVPTSVGYGASFNGLAALLGMLNSCASGITVVNIDNGFGAAFAALRILQNQ